jgi:hypothetical protein
MILCRDASLETWTPKFTSSGQPNPTWIRVKCEGVKITNALTWVDWTENPVQLLLCDACGFAGCGTGGYAHVGRVADSVLLTAPQLDDADEWERSQYDACYAVRKFGAILIQHAEWEHWHSVAGDTPVISKLRPANGRAIADAWRMSAHHPNRASTLAEVVPLLQDRLLGSDTMEPSQVIRNVEILINLLKNLHSEEASGRFVDPAEVGASVEMLYFDGPKDQDWAGLALLGDQVLPAFGKEIVYVPTTAVQAPAGAA